MRRRHRGKRNLTAEQVISLYQGTKLAHRGTSLEVRNHALRQALAGHGYDVIDAIRARYWIRRGKPANYQWDA